MITCVVEYVIDPAEIDAFERFGRRWIELVNTHGGKLCWREGAFGLSATGEAKRRSRDC